MWRWPIATQLLPSTWAAGQFSVKGYFDTRLPGQSYFGAEPVALAVNGDGSRLYVANMGTDSVAVFERAS